MGPDNHTMENRTMTKQFINLDIAPSLEIAEGLMLWAAIVVEVDGGWIGFESVDDYNQWENQK